MIQEMKALMEVAKKNLLDWAMLPLEKEKEDILIDAYNYVCYAMGREQDRIYKIFDKLNFLSELSEADDEIFDQLIKYRHDGVSFVWREIDGETLKPVDSVALLETIENYFNIIFKGVLFYNEEELQPLKEILITEKMFEL